jgi:hypothetical protein
MPNMCCAVSDNLELQTSEKPDLIVRKCRICGLRHFELSIDPIKLGLKGASL